MNQPADAEKYRSVNTPTLPMILNDLGISLFVTTYQAGRLVVIRSEGEGLNTHFCALPKPMGLYCDDQQLFVTTRARVLRFRNQVDVAKKIEPLGKYDACFLPQVEYVTGDIFAHEIAVTGKQLWIANTRFSCLATLSEKFSFIPQWRPSFITELHPVDKCHLNGLAVVDGRPKYVTALGMSNDPSGWREHKANGGVLIDVELNEIVAQSLSMPHSPRNYENRIWVLESGNGSLATVDLNSGKLELVALLPGFTRGLDFFGPYAFIGLSQIRESALAAGLPIADRVEKRECGVYVVDIRNGKVAGFLRFEDHVQEIFAVHVLPGIRYPHVITDNSDEHIDESWYVPRPS